MLADPESAWLQDALLDRIRCVAEQLATRLCVDEICRWAQILLKLGPALGGKSAALTERGRQLERGWSCATDVQGRWRPTPSLLPPPPSPVQDWCNDPARHGAYK